ncbi:hypothetical protein A6A08_05140 [Nocardiopsis sp. TSRI0078]|uniref:hypothetical protein n=1 Tax=unclassified Nocardiopsis TaxID=2649073 RepID=UPI00093A16B3|nr:hypothetical protein [Nocardiopsis sp. TSRI0078]OKI18991.1 hypothetical protein A6A08_05140 [Nocardiopsis sp. TSRI0078]
MGEREVYKGALTVLMRLVFLLYAEEQWLLPTDDLYAEYSSVTRVHDQLADDRNQIGEEAGDRRAAAWPRLPALFAGIHDGAEHPDLRLPAYGGSLFRPTRSPVVTRRTARRPPLDARRFLNARGASKRAARTPGAAHEKGEGSALSVGCSAAPAFKRVRGIVAPTRAGCPPARNRGTKR